MRFDWTRLVNRGTRETTGSVRRSIEAVTEGLELLPPGSHLDPPQARQTISGHPGFRGGARRHLVPRIGALTTAAERLQGSPLNAEIRNGSEGEWAATGVQIYAVSDER
jgi:hypothetical protein